MQLENLDLSYNNITHLGRLQFIEQERLQHLNLSNNFISSLHSKDTFKGPLSLQTLDIGKNMITSLKTATFNGLQSLIELHLTSNRISIIEKGAFDGLNRLRVIHLEHNYIESINSSWLQELNSLRFLYLSNNRLKQLNDGTFKPLVALSVLSLYENRIHTVGDMAFEGPIGRSLDTLDMSYNLLSDVPSTAFSYLSKMASLDLSGNPIKVLTSTSFSQMYVIERLLLNNMYLLGSIEGQTFAKNGKLSQVYLEHNLELAPLPYGIFRTNSVLKALSLRNNTNFKTLSPHQIPVRSIRQLMISGISFNCNCSLTWLWEMYQSANESGIKIDAARCKEYTKRSIPQDEQSSNHIVNEKDNDLLSKMHPDQLICSDVSPQKMVVIIAVSVLIIVCVFLAAAVVAMFRYKRYKSRSGSGYGSPCLHIKDDTMVFRGTLKYDHQLHSNQINNHMGVLNSEMMIQMPSPPSYHSTNQNVSKLDINEGKLSPINQVQNLMVNNGMVEDNNEPVYEMPKYTELPTSSEGSDPKSSVSGSSKYSSCGYVGSELWEPEYFVNLSNVAGATSAHCYTNPALSNSRTLNGSGNMNGSPLNSNGASSGIGSGSGSGSSTVSNQQGQQFKPVFFSPQPRHIGNGYNMVSTLNYPSNMNCDRSYYHHSLYQNGAESTESYPSNTTSRMMPFSSPQVISKYSNGTFLRSPFMGDREPNSSMSSPPPPAPYDSTLNRPSTTFVMFNKPPRTSKRKNQKSRAHDNSSSSWLKGNKYTSDSKANINLQASRENSNKTINSGMNIAKQLENESLRANSYL